MVTGNYKFVTTPNGTVAEASTTAIRHPMILSISTQNENAVRLSWTGDFPRYQVQRRALDDSSWVDIGEATTNRNFSLTLDGPGAMFRVIAVTP